MSTDARIADERAAARARDLRTIRDTAMQPTRERLTSIISTAIHGLHEDLTRSPATEQDLQGVEFSVRRLKALSKRMRRSIRIMGSMDAPATPGSEMQERLQAAEMVAKDLLAGEPWRVICTLAGVASVHYTAKHHDGDVSVHVHASSLEGLVRGIDAVELDDLAAVDESAAA
jgi:hypothetical protein